MHAMDSSTCSSTRRQATPAPVGQAPAPVRTCRPGRGRPAAGTHLLKAVDDAGAGHQVRVGDVRPVGDLVDAAAVLHDHRVANVGKLAVLKDKEVCGGRGDQVHWASHRRHWDCRVTGDGVDCALSGPGQTACTGPRLGKLLCRAVRVPGLLSLSWAGRQPPGCLFPCTPARSPCFSASCCSLAANSSLHLSNTSTWVLKTQMWGPTCDGGSQDRGSVNRLYRDSMEHSCGRKGGSLKEYKHHR